MPPDSRSVPRKLARAIGDRPDRFAHVLKDALAELHQALGRRRHPHLTADAQKQRFAELFFEQQNLPADRRLRDVQLAAGRGERSGLGDGLKDFELAQVHEIRRRSLRNDTPCASGPSHVTTKRDDEHERDEPAHRLRVGEPLAERRLDVGNAGREHHAELIREARERTRADGSATAR